MPAIVRSILAVLAGLVAGGTVNLLLIRVGGSLVPPPPGVDPDDPASINAHLGEYAPIQFLVPFLAHALGTLVGAMVATRLAKDRGPRPAWIVGGCFLLGGISMVTTMPNTPGWFAALDLGLAYLPMAWLGRRLVAGRAGPSPST